MTRFKKQISRTSTWLLLVTVLLFMAIESSHATPINSNTAFAPHKGESILRLQSRFYASGHDTTIDERKLRVLQVNGVYIYGFTERFTGILSVPYVDKSFRSTNEEGERIRRDVSGFGDMRTLLKYRVFTVDKPGLTHRLGLFAGVEWPTGDDNEKDFYGRLPQPLQLGSGSYDPIVGMVWTTQTLGWELDADLSYKWNNEANDFEFGNQFFYNVSYQHRLWPRQLPEEGVPSFVYGVLELNGSLAEKNELNRVADPDSGGHTLFISPGLQWVSSSWVVETSVQIPVIQDLRGNALKADYAVTFGVRFRF